MADKEDLSYFDKMLSSNRKALENLLVQGSAETSGSPGRSPNEALSEQRPLAPVALSQTKGLRQPTEKPLSSQAPAKVSGTKLNAKSDGMSFTFRSG